MFLDVGKVGTFVSTLLLHRCVFFFRCGEEDRT